MNDFSLLKKILLGLAVVFLFGNLLVLDYLSFFKGPVGGEEIILQVSPTPTGASDDCPRACLDLIDTSLVAEEVPTPVSVEKVEVEEKENLAKEVYFAKETYVPLGSGTVASADWQEIGGLEAVIDRANYSQIKSIIFEGSLSIPTGNGVVSAKLFNVTDKHEVWFSQIEVQGAASQRTESKEISLSSGRKLYRVMMKSSMSYEAILKDARIKIILE